LSIEEPGFQIAVPQKKTVRSSVLNLTALTAVLWYVFFEIGLSQSPRIQFEHLSIDQGLSNATVTAIIQDHLGFIWVGTEDGLNKYDGYTFTVFKHHPADSSSIIGNNIRALSVDSDGNLWIGTDSGLDKYDQGRNRFVHYSRIVPSLAELNEVLITSLTFDDSGILWIATFGKGVLAYNPRTDSVTEYRHDAENTNSIAADVVTTIYIDSRMRVWIGTYSAGVTLLLPLQSKMINIRRLPSDAGGTTSSRAMAIAEDDVGRILVGTFGAGVCAYDERRQEFVRYPTTGDPLPVAIFSIASDHHGRLWIGTFDVGLQVFNSLDGTISRFRYNASDPGSISSDRIHVISQDHSGSMWMGTWKGGLSVYQPYKSKFEHYAHAWYDSSSLSDNTVWSILEDHTGTLWVGTEHGGLNRYEPDGNLFIHYTHMPSRPQSISSNFVKTICEDSSGMLWIGAYGGGIDKLDRSGNVIQRFHHNPDDPRSLAEDGVNILFFDRDNDLWVGGGYLDRYDHRTKGFIHYDSTKLGRVSFNAKDIQSITQDSSGALWIASFGGYLYRLDKKTNSVRQYPALGGLYCLHTDPSGAIWIGSFGKGLFRYKSATDDFENFTESDGLPSNFIKGIVSDDRGNLWLSTSKGLSRFNTKARSFRNYDPGDGLQAYEFRTASCFKGRSGRIYFGGVNGFNAFFPDSVYDNPIMPPVLLTSFKVFDKAFDVGASLSTLPEIKLSYWHDFFSFEFVALNFTSPEKNRYAYKLEGFDKEWISSGTRRYANYTHLDGGEYNFRVKASNNDDVWNEAGASIRIVISPPFWKTWWFLTASGTLVCISVYTLYRYRVGKILEVERTRAAISSDLHDDIGTSLTRIALFSDLAKREARSNLPTMYDRLDVIADISRSMLDQMNDIVWSVNPDNDSLQNIVLRMEDTAVKLFDAAGIEYHISLPPYVHDNKLPMTVRRNIFLVFKELVNNVIKHSQCTRADIEISFDSSSQTGTLTLVVSDDGKGFEPAREYQGNGLKNMRMRAQSIGGTMSIASSENGGARSTLIVPLSARRNLSYHLNR